MDYLSRQKTFQRTLEKHNLDGFVITHPPDLRYLCGYTGSHGLLLFVAGRRVLYTDGRYTEQARKEVRGARLVISRGSLMTDAARLIDEQLSATIGFDSGQTTVATAAQMRDLVSKRIRWKPSTSLVMRQRLVKEADELAVIREAVNLGARVYRNALEFIHSGVPETEVAARLEFAARRAGSEGMSFDTIVAAGKRSALPHARASAARIPRRGYVVVDSGVILRGYCSDMTRTVHVGRVNRSQREWYEAVLEAQLAGISSVRAGVQAGEVDASARHVLRRCKLDRYFTHSTGHGVGLEIHEPPRLGKAQTEQLVPGMVITIEPGIYVPGKGGIRIEDMVLVTREGCEVLTPTGKELVEII